MRIGYALTAAGLAAALISGTAIAGVADSKHNLSDPAATNEVCVFCHTPHGASSDVTAPLWNRAAGTASYTRYSSLGTATLDGEEVAVGSVSLACLSCHDGTQAMDSVINQPGSGGYTAGGAEISSGAGSVISNMSGEPIPMLGTDLSNDHPVSIEYAGGACNGVAGNCDPQTSAVADIDKDFMPVSHSVINTKNQWWVDVDNFFTDSLGTVAGTGVNGTREKTDMILYARTFTAGEGPSVECASCHDPHESDARPVQFMRISNAGSAVCLACHIK